MGVFVVRGELFGGEVGGKGGAVRAVFVEEESADKETEYRGKEGVQV